MRTRTLQAVAAAVGGPIEVQVNGIDNLAEDVFGIPARAAHARTMSGLTSAFENPQFSAAIGLIKYAQAVQGDRQPRSRFGRLFGRFFQGMR